MDERFQAVVSSIPTLFESLQNSQPFAAKALRAHRGLSGVYAFFERGSAQHVGRTKNLEQRLRGHVSASHFSASFAFKCTRRTLQRVATYRVEGSRSALMKDQIFRLEFDRQVLRLKGMEVRFVEIADPAKQYLLELYAHMAWGIPLDEFETH